MYVQNVHSNLLRSLCVGYDTMMSLKLAGHVDSVYCMTLYIVGQHYVVAFDGIAAVCDLARYRHACVCFSILHGGA